MISGFRRASGRRLLLALVVFVVACDAGSASAPICASDGSCEEHIPSTSALHVAGPIDYPDPPPTGGDHDACWTTFGVHATEVLDENWVHNLEHGAVVFLYSCPSGCAPEASSLAALASGRPFAVVSSYSEMPAGFAAVAWEHRLVTEALDLAAFESFYAAHVDRAPESSSVNPPLSCDPAP